MLGIDHAGKTFRTRCRSRKSLSAIPLAPLKMTPEDNRSLWSRLGYGNNRPAGNHRPFLSLWVGRSPWALPEAPLWRCFLQRCFSSALRLPWRSSPSASAQTTTAGRHSQLSRRLASSFGSFAGNYIGGRDKGLQTKTLGGEG